MGCFSWMYADLDNCRPLLIGAPAYVMCPFGDAIFEPAYKGYGIFDGYDIYELVVEWNRKDIKRLIQNSTHKCAFEWPDNFLDCLVESDIAAEKYARVCFPEKSWIRKEWKRNIGIDISNYNDQNRILRYPIKITRRKDCPYSMLPASMRDKGQGLGYFDEEL